MLSIVPCNGCLRVDGIFYKFILVSFRGWFRVGDCFV